MRKILILGLVTCFMLSLAFAQEKNTITIRGDIIDNLCASSQKIETLPEFVKMHTKECALMPGCVASGYSIFFDGKLMRFDKKSNDQIERFLKNPASKLQVVVEATKVGDTLSLVAIANQ